MMRCCIKGFKLFDIINHDIPSYINSGFAMLWSGIIREITNAQDRMHLALQDIPRKIWRSAFHEGNVEKTVLSKHVPNAHILMKMNSKIYCFATRKESYSSSLRPWYIYRLQHVNFKPKPSWDQVQIAVGLLHSIHNGFDVCIIL